MQKNMFAVLVAAMLLSLRFCGDYQEDITAPQETTGETEIVSTSSTESIPETDNTTVAPDVEVQPTEEPTEESTEEPTEEPTEQPTEEPTEEPTETEPADKGNGDNSTKDDEL